MASQPHSSNDLRCIWLLIETSALVQQMLAVSLELLINTVTVTSPPA